MQSRENEKDFLLKDVPNVLATGWNAMITFVVKFLCSICGVTLLFSIAVACSQHHHALRPLTISH